MLKYGKMQAAFTKLELLCVLSILALLTATAVPLLDTLMPERELETAARGMAMEMRRMQQAAITAGRTFIMDFRIFVNDYWIYDYLGGESRCIKLPAGITYAANTFPSGSGHPRLEFKYTGAPNQGGTVGLKNSKNEFIYVIVTPATGRVRVSREPPEHW